jgi:hypothetical protein
MSAMWIEIWKIFKFLCPSQSKSSIAPMWLSILYNVIESNLEQIGFSNMSFVPLNDISIYLYIYEQNTSYISELVFCHMHIKCNDADDENDLFITHLNIFSMEIVYSGDYIAITSSVSVGSLDVIIETEN